MRRSTENESLGASDAGGGEDKEEEEVEAEEGEKVQCGSLRRSGMRGKGMM